MFLPFVLLSCGKKAIDLDENYIGFWKGSDQDKSYVLRVEEDGKGRYSYTGSGKTSSYRGGVRIKDDKLFVGLKQVEINQLPDFQDSVIYMVLDGVKMEQLVNEW